MDDNRAEKSAHGQVSRHCSTFHGPAPLRLPAFARSKASARDTGCLNNLHQIGIALQMYVDENENRLPTMFDSPITADAGITNALLPSAGKVLLPFLTSSNLLRCPSDDRKLF